MVLHPLEFSECFLDSPWFRVSIKEYEDELERTNSQIKQLIKDAKSMLQASRKQGEMMQVFSDRLQKFQFEIIGENLTDDERGIAGSLKEFGMMLEEIDGEWSRTMERCELQLIQPLENFRKDHIHSYRDAKKAFDKSSERYYKQMEQTLGLSHKKKENHQLEADNELLMQKKLFHRTSLNYVYKLQEVQERKKFEFVEHLLMFMQVYFNFFHQTHETAIDCKEYMSDIQMRLISTRSQYEGTRDKTQMLMRKMMDDPTGNQQANSSPNRVVGQRWARAGYLQLLEKKFAAKWTRFFCMYTKENKLFQMLPPVTQSSSSSSNASTRIASINHGSSGIAVDPLIVLSCVRRITESIDKRFCFDIDVEDSAGKQSSLTLQALSNLDRKKWLAVMDGKEPNYITTNEYKKPDQFALNKTSIKFVEDVIAEIERRGVDAEGIYRLVGVSSKVDRLLQIVMDPDIPGKLDYRDEMEWELNTLTSALKNFFRNLPEPIMTFDMHEDFIVAAKQENPEERLKRVKNLVAKLLPDSQHILKMLIRHLQKVAGKCEINKMSFQNIGVCFGPTLMRPRQETVQSIMEIKFNNIIVEILIENYEAVFGPDEEGQGASKEKTPHVHKQVERLPSQRFRTRPRKIHEDVSVDTIPEGRTPSPARNLHPSQQEEQNPRFMRAHAFRGPAGRPLSPRSQMKLVNTTTVKTGNEEESLSSSDNNMDEFGRISPLDLNLNLDHHFPANHLDSKRSPTPPSSSGHANPQPPEHPPGPRMHKEEWRPEPARRPMRKTSSRRLDRNAKGSQSERHPSPTRARDEKMEALYSYVRKKSVNRNQNNNEKSGDVQSPSVRQRTEKLMDSIKHARPEAVPPPRKSSEIKRRKSPVQDERPEIKPNNDHASSFHVGKLKEKFSPQSAKPPNSQTSPQVKPDQTEDALSFLWPRPGSIKPNTFVEGSVSRDTRPRSTVVLSRGELSPKTEKPGAVHDLHGFESPSPQVGAEEAPRVGRVVETLYACEGEHETELSFVAGKIIRDVRESDEPGWLVGNLDGVVGLVPANYIRDKLWE